MIDNVYNLVLTDEAILFLENSGRFIAAPDFNGYVVSLPTRFHSVLLVWLSGEFEIFSTKNSKGISYNTRHKIYKYLLKYRFIRNGNYDPFPEFEKYSNIECNLSNVEVVNSNIFMRIQ